MTTLTSTLRSLAAAALMTCSVASPAQTAAAATNLEPLISKATAEALARFQTAKELTSADVNLILDLASKLASGIGGIEKKCACLPVKPPQVRPIPGPTPPSPILTNAADLQLGLQVLAIHNKLKVVANKQGLSISPP